MEKGKESAAKKAFEKYQQDLQKRKDDCKHEPDKSKRFWKYVWLVISFPWQWLWMACHDWKLILIYIGWMAIVGSEVWIPFILGICAPEGAFRTSMLSVASAGEAFWLLPLTPFMPLCIALTIGTKAVMNNIVAKRQAKPHFKTKKMVEIVRKSKLGLEYTIRYEPVLPAQKIFDDYMKYEKEKDDSITYLWCDTTNDPDPENYNCEQKDGNSFAYSYKTGDEWYYRMVEIRIS